MGLHRKTGAALSGVNLGLDAYRIRCLTLSSRRMIGMTRP
jgi:hypothetical protein